MLPEQDCITVQSCQITAHRAGFILSPDQRNRSKGRQNGTQGTGKQGVLGSEVNGSEQQVYEDGGIEQGVGMVRHQ